MRAWSALTAAALLCTLHAHAADPAQLRCNQAYEDGQRLRRAGTLRRARDELLVCTRDPCPARQQAECSEWLKSLEAAIPSFIPVAKVDGREVVDVSVTVDGDRRLERLDGRAIDVDPGAHVVRFERQGEAPIEVQVVAHEAEKNQLVPADFVHAAPKPPEQPPKAEPRPTPPAPAPERPVPWTVYALGGASVLSLGGFVLFATQGSSRQGDLDSQGCKPNCDPSDTDAIKKKFLIADVFLGVSLAAAATATVLFLLRPEERIR
jgi:hypothetical protein